MRTLSGAWVEVLGDTDTEVIGIVATDGIIGVWKKDSGQGCYPKSVEALDPNPYWDIIPSNYNYTVLLDGMFYALENKPTDFGHRYPNFMGGYLKLGPYAYACQDEGASLRERKSLFSWGLIPKNFIYATSVDGEARAYEAIRFMGDDRFGYFVAPAGSGIIPEGEILERPCGV